MAHLKLHVRKNDTVVVISGKDQGKTGEVLKVYPKTGKVLLELPWYFCIRTFQP